MVTEGVRATASIHFTDRSAAGAPRRTRTGRNRSAGVAALADASRPARSAARPRPYKGTRRMRVDLLRAEELLSHRLKAKENDEMGEEEKR